MLDSLVLPRLIFAQPKQRNPRLGRLASLRIKSLPEELELYALAAASTENPHISRAMESSLDYLLGRSVAPGSVRRYLELYQRHQNGLLLPYLDRESLPDFPLFQRRCRLYSETWGAAHGAEILSYRTGCRVTARDLRETLLLGEIMDGYLGKERLTTLVASLSLKYQTRLTVSQASRMAREGLKLRGIHVRTRRQASKLYKAGAFRLDT